MAAPSAPALKGTSLRRRLLIGAAAAAVGGAVLLWYAASDDLPPPASRSLLESIMPTYDVQEVHSTHVDARPADVYAAIAAVTPGEIALARPFMWLRTIPARLGGGRRMDDGQWNRPFFSVPGTAVLASEREREVVVGLIGRFWKLRGGARVAVESRDQFIAFDTPGFAVSTLSFHIEPDGDGSRVTTITRVRTTDPESRRAFLAYWRFIGTGSAVLRRTWLRAVKVRAERPMPPRPQ